MKDFVFYLLNYLIIIYLFKLFKIFCRVVQTFNVSGSASAATLLLRLTERSYLYRYDTTLWNPVQWKELGFKISKVWIVRANNKHKIPEMN